MKNIQFSVEKVSMFSDSAVGLGSSCQGTLHIRPKGTGDQDEVFTCSELSDLLDADFKHGFIVFYSRDCFIKSSAIAKLNFGDDAVLVTTQTSIYRIRKVVD